MELSMRERTRVFVSYIGDAGDPGTLWFCPAESKNTKGDRGHMGEWEETAAKVDIFSPGSGRETRTHETTSYAA